MNRLNKAANYDIEDQNENSMFVSQMSEEEIIGIVNACKHTTATASNDLSMSVIKKSY